MGGEKKFLVVVLGWWQSESRHLRKYTELFNRVEKVGRVIDATMSTAGLVIPPVRKQEAHRIVARISEAMQRFSIEHGGTEPKLVFHAMSNNGVVMFLALQDVMPDSMRGTVAGAIFDSSPGALNLQTGIGAFIESKPSPLLLGGLAGISLYAIHRVGVSKSLACMTAAAAISHITSNALTTKYHETFVHDKIKCPSLFLYSKEDTLVSYKAVENVMQRKREAGAQVYSKVFEGSAHVAHLRQHGTEYRNAVETFFNKLDE